MIGATASAYAYAHGSRRSPWPRLELPGAPVWTQAAFAAPAEERPPKPPASFRHVRGKSRVSAACCCAAAGRSRMHAAQLYIKDSHDECSAANPPVLQSLSEGRRPCDLSMYTCVSVICDVRVNHPPAGVTVRVRVSTSALRNCASAEAADQCRGNKYTCCVCYVRPCGLWRLQTVFHACSSCCRAASGAFKLAPLSREMYIH